MTTKIMIGIAVYVFFFLAGLAWIHFRKHPVRRFNDGGRDSILEDGAPGGSRSHVWSDKERAEYRRDRDRRKLRVIQ